MKHCPVCRLVLQDSFLFCPDDGSSLKDGAPGKSPLAADSVDEAIESDHARKPPQSPVLYCPACAIEYPLTFTHCPVHGAPLTKQIRVSTIKRPSVIRETERDEIGAGPSEKQTHSRRSHPSAKTYGSDDPPGDDSYDGGPLNLRQGPVPVLNTPRPRPLQRHGESDNPVTEEQSLGQGETGTGDSTTPRRSMRIAATLTAVGLALFAIASVYTFISSAGRKPSAVRQTPAANAQVTQEPLAVPIPYAAPEAESQEEAENQSKDEASPADETQPEAAENSGVKGKSAVPDKPEHARGDEQRPDLRAAPVAATVAHRTSAPELPIPAGAPARVDGRLIRVHSIRTPSGYHYDLTFSLEELAGQTTQWERLVVKTRASSGAGRVEIIPFFHRLGASGMLTFTIGVEMRGPAQSDWRGQVICTAIGYDLRDRAYRASFGANVLP